MREFKTEEYIKDGLSLAIFKASDSVAFEAHTHEFTEIKYVLDGEAVELINDTEYRVKRGDLLFINYGSTHAFTPIGDLTYFNICFSPDILIKRIISRENAFDLLSLSAFDEICRSDNDGVIKFFGEQRHLIELLLSDMLKEFESDLSERTAVLESYMSIVITKILRRMHPSSETALSEDGHFTELCEYIDQNLDKRLTLTDLAKKCFYNPSYFSRVFKEKFGITLADYLTKRRANHAAKLLTETDLTSEAIAEACGYNDKSGLYRAFSKVYGMKPSEYRRLCKKK